MLVFLYFFSQQLSPTFIPSTVFFLGRRGCSVFLVKPSANPMPTSVAMGWNVQIFLPMLGPRWLFDQGPSDPSTNAFAFSPSRPFCCLLGGPHPALLCESDPGVTPERPVDLCYMKVLILLCLKALVG